MLVQFFSSLDKFVDPMLIKIKRIAGNRYCLGFLNTHIYRSIDSQLQCRFFSNDFETPIRSGHGNNVHTPANRSTLSVKHFYPLLSTYLSSFFGMYSEFSSLHGCCPDSLAC